MKERINKIKLYLLSHKVINVIILIVILLLGYWGYGKINDTTGEIRYMMANVGRGNIVSSVVGSGQVSALNQIDIKPDVSGTITYVGVEPGDEVTSGKLLFSLDSTTAQKSVRDAEINLQNAELSLQKLQIQNSNENTDASLTKVYSDGFNAVSTTFLDLPSTLSGIKDLLGETNLSDGAARQSGNTAINYRDKAESASYVAERAYNKNKKNFGILTYNSEPKDIEASINETYNTTQLLAGAIKSLNDYVNYLAEDTGQYDNFTDYQDTLSEYTNTINSDSSTLLVAKTDIQDYKNLLPTNDIDLESALITVTQKENALIDAKQDLADYYIRAPFAGIIASVPVIKGDNASSSTTLGTVITAERVATISLNEIDIARVQLGQKVTLTFDAITDLVLAGKVAEIDSIGTVSSGVVNYNVKISFDTSDERIKPGMTVSADITTETKENVLIVPGSAVKTLNNESFVQIFNPEIYLASGSQGIASGRTPEQKKVVVGASDDTNVEILSGLQEGEQIVTRTISGATTTPNASGGGLGNVRVRQPF
ncbi:hypothetical protein A2121_00520 [Candidatus Nomurabacteria bacterium GWB1_40_6]|uniref:Uncharacterized protein n=1 Tax=Candidatus Nomurabacteria bacterium GWB1_40_6 TaxID=1801727 RepID=A0A1F6TQ49_9BACT|nr:MAG: hypothetical protein A2121_00520 [Candidatus Nomurabacteria bacterium GWB1_40_6]